MAEAGHDFLARLGKRRLRPGGVAATNWLMEQGEFYPGMQVLEVACNMGTTSIELAKKYQVQITGIDLNRKALEKAQVNIKKAHLEDLIHVQRANALKLPFPDNSFDIVINEAMLTMLPENAKSKAVQEYYRVLKPGGKLLTHDVSYLDRSVVSELAALRQAINVNVTPLYIDDWKELFKQTGFKQVDSISGQMTLMSPKGMVQDEGVPNTLRILRNGIKKENRPMFKKMFKFFNTKGKKLHYIAVTSTK